MISRNLTRRSIIGGAAMGAALVALPGRPAAQSGRPARRRVPSSGEAVPAVGLGTWITFNVGSDPVLLRSCADVMAAFFDAGGRAIDSSPMYGSSQGTLGYGLSRLGRPPGLFPMDKVWTGSAENGPAQIEQSRREWGIPEFSLMQVHNLRGWEHHLPMLFDMKADGRIRYVGITTSHGRRHRPFEEILRAHPVDFVQVTYNVLDREVEDRILPLARDRGIGVIVNRPFRQGALTEWLSGRPLPEWTAEIGASSWAQLILKFILWHPGVTMVIPATTRVDHVRENVAAAAGPLPDAAMRERISAHVRSL